LFFKAVFFAFWVVSPCFLSQLPIFLNLISFVFEGEASNFRKFHFPVFEEAKTNNGKVATLLSPLKFNAAPMRLQLFLLPKLRDFLLLKVWKASVDLCEVLG
jgi:hypothetical protein